MLFPLLFFIFLLFPNLSLSCLVVHSPECPCSFTSFDKDSIPTSVIYHGYYLETIRGRIEISKPESIEGENGCPTEVKCPLGYSIVTFYPNDLDADKYSSGIITPSCSATEKKWTVGSSQMDQLIVTCANFAGFIEMSKCKCPSINFIDSVGISYLRYAYYLSDRNISKPGIIVNNDCEIEVNVGSVPFFNYHVMVFRDDAPPIFVHRNMPEAPKLRSVSVNGITCNLVENEYQWQYYGGKVKNLRIVVQDNDPHCRCNGWEASEGVQSVSHRNSTCDSLLFKCENPEHVAYFKTTDGNEFPYLMAPFSEFVSQQEVCVETEKEYFTWFYHGISVGPYPRVVCHEPVETYDFSKPIDILRENCECPNIRVGTDSDLLQVYEKTQYPIVASSLKVAPTSINYSGEGCGKVNIICTNSQFITYLSTNFEPMTFPIGQEPEISCHQTSPLFAPSYNTPSYWFSNGIQLSQFAVVCLSEEPNKVCPCSFTPFDKDSIPTSVIYHGYYLETIRGRIEISKPESIQGEDGCPTEVKCPLGYSIVTFYPNDLDADKYASGIITPSCSATEKEWTVESCSQMDQLIVTCANFSETNKCKCPSINSIDSIGIANLRYGHYLSARDIFNPAINVNDDCEIEVDLSSITEENYHVMIFRDDAPPIFTFRNLPDTTKVQSISPDGITCNQVGNEYQWQYYGGKVNNMRIVVQSNKDHCRCKGWDYEMTYVENVTRLHNTCDSLYFNCGGPNEQIAYFSTLSDDEFMYLLAPYGEFVTQQGVCIETRQNIYKWFYNGMLANDYGYVICNRPHETFDIYTPLNLSRVTSGECECPDIRLGTYEPLLKSYKMSQFPIDTELIKSKSVETKINYEGEGCGTPKITCGSDAQFIMFMSVNYNPMTFPISEGLPSISCQSTSPQFSQTYKTPSFWFVDGVQLAQPAVVCLTEEVKKICPCAFTEFHYYDIPVYVANHKFWIERLASGVSDYAEGINGNDGCQMEFKCSEGGTLVILNTNGIDAEIFESGIIQSSCSASDKMWTVGNSRYEKLSVTCYFGTLENE